MEPYERTIKSAEKEKWRLYKFELEKLHLEFHICREYRKNYEICYYFGKEHGIKLPIPVTLMQQYQEIDRNVKRLAQWKKWAEDHTLGIRLTGDDLDIIAPPDTNQDMLMEYRNPTLSGWPAVIAVGVVVVGAVISYIALLKDEVKEATREYNELVGMSQSRFCADPNSATCQSWLKAKKTNGLERNEGIIAGIKRTLSGMTMEIGKGAGAGLLIAIPLVMMYFLMRKKDKK